MTDPGLPPTTGEGNTADVPWVPETLAEAIDVWHSATAVCNELGAALRACHDARRAVEAERDALREQLDAARQLVDAAKPGLSIPPADCTNNCMDGPCDCSGKRRVTAWAVDVPALRAALGVEAAVRDQEA